MNIEALNLLTDDIAEIPKYTPNPKFRCIKAYYPNNEDVILQRFAERCDQLCNPYMTEAR